MGYVKWQAIFVDFIFFLDIIIKFNTPVYKQGRLVTNRKQIALLYVKTWFILDFLALIPFSFLRKNSEHWPRWKNE